MFAHRLLRYLSILVPGLVAGALVTLLAWLELWTPLRMPGWLSSVLFCTGAVAVLLWGYLLRSRHPLLSQALVFTVVIASVGLAYLFPEALAPGCGGMPKAFASCTEECDTECETVCTKWVPDDDPRCVYQPSPWDIGCCLRYGESCTTTCTTTCWDDAPTVGATPACSLPGNGSWCRGDAGLVISASDPQGYSLSISGKRGSDDFFCTGATCPIALPQGTGTVSFTAIAGTSGLTASGSFNWARDSLAPQVSGGIGGLGGDAGWLVSEGILTASVSDAVPGSGLAGFNYSVDGGAWTAYTGPVTIPDGVHTVNLQASDAAGNTGSASVSASVDTQPPSSSFTTSPPGWARGTLSLGGTSTDATSGVALVELSLDGGAGWQSLGATTGWGYAWDTTSVPDGSYTIQVRAVDTAGNEGNAASLTVHVDNTPPQLRLSGPASFCPSCTGVELTVSVSDASGGVASWSLSDDAGSVLASGSGPTSPRSVSWRGRGLPLGDHTVSLTATDAAGNAGSIILPVRLRAAPPDPEPTTEAYLIPAVLPGVPPLPMTQPTRTPAPARQQSIVAVVPESPPSIDENSFGPPPGSSFPDILWGAAAVAATTAALAYAAENRANAQPRVTTTVSHSFRELPMSAELASRLAAYEASLNQPAAASPPQPMPPGLSPEAQQAFLHGGPAAQQWVIQNADSLRPPIQSVVVPPNSSTAPFPACTAPNSTYASGGAPAGWNAYDPIAGISVGAYDAWMASPLQLQTLPSGYISVTANTAPGTRLDYRAALLAEQGFDFSGTRYLPSTVTNTIGTNLLNGAWNGSAWAMAGGTSLISNSVQYGWGATSVDDFADRTVRNQDFWASTIADAVVGVATGMLAAGLVTLGLVGLAALGVAAVPVAAVVLTTAVVAAVIGIGLSQADVNDNAQNVANAGIDWVQSWFQ